MVREGTVVLLRIKGGTVEEVMTLALSPKFQELPSRDISIMQRL
jgi:hypothetical protein